MKTTLKKLIGGILIVCMIMGMIPFSAFATGIISIINLTIDAPEAGKAPSFTASLPETASTRVLSVKWSPEDGVFKENGEYTVSVEIGIKPGLDKAFTSNMSKMSVKVNGKKTSDVSPNGANVIVKYTWNLSKKAENEDNAQKNTKNVFTDVKEDAYYADAVSWAVDKQITAGTSATTFSPEDTCTRAQILTFLWRAVGSPKNDGFIMFNDVKADAYYYNAAVWAASNGMVEGKDFEPNTPCTRAYTVIYLWKYAGSPKTEISNVFSDVPADSEYAQAVAWAVKTGVTSGTSATTFSPYDTCTRGQIVTFLNRALASAENEQPDKTTSPTPTVKPTDTAKPSETAKPTQSAKPDKTTSTTQTPAKTPSADELDNENNWKKPGVFNNTRPSYDKDVYEAAIKKALKEALGDNMGANMTDLQKALALHDWLALNCQYDETKSRKYAYSEYGAIVEGIAVCQGYTIAYNDLLTRAGIEAEYVAGWLGTAYQAPGRHSWSRVTIDGKKYFVDVTSDDVPSNTKGRVTHSFFMVSDKKMIFHSGYNVHCTDTTYDDSLLHGMETPLFWNEKAKKFYYIDTYGVKMTSDFTEKMTPLKTKNEMTPDGAVITDDQKYIIYFKMNNYTSQYPLYLYNTETDEYFTYTVKDINNVIFCGMRLNGYNVEVVREYYKNKAPYMTKVEASVPIPANFKKRAVTFNLNYSGAAAAKSCEYINNYWTNGDGSFDEPKRNGYTFGGWYTAPDGGKKVESFEEIEGDNTTLYAHWWGKWSISEEPTLTESGKVVRSLDGYPNVTEEKTIPNLSDTSVWKKTLTVESTTEREGYDKYSSEYGEVRVVLPKKELEYGIVYKKDSVYITVLNKDNYTVEFETADSSAKMKVIVEVAGEYRVIYPKTFTPSGNIKATLYDGEMKEICSVEYEV